MNKINSVKLIIEFVDSETGELTTQEATLGDFKNVEKKATTTRTRKSKDDGEPTAMIHVLDNKIQFNNKAIELTGFEPENHVLIEFEKKGRQFTPIMSLKDKGNRMTKTFTVSYRGQQRDQLVQYGTDFEVVADESRPGFFKLIGNVPQEEDDIIDVPEEIGTDGEIDTDLADVLDDNFNFDF